MKRIFISLGAVSAFLALQACSDFDKININPTAASVQQVQVDYLINNSIIGAQQDPHVAERAFVLYWKTAGHQHASTGISGGTYNDGWSSDYYRYVSDWLNSANTAIQVADAKMADGSAKSYTNNLKQVARIWRAYLMSELSDNFGPIPINGFQGTNPEFSDVKSVYYFLLAELKDATAKMDATAAPGTVKPNDPAYGYDFDKWKKYANSMRMRLAMRLSEVDAAKAKQEFEEAAAAGGIKTMAETFQVKEKPGWDPLTGVMSREWNAQFISATYYNLTLGLGGVPTSQQLAANYHAAIKPANYMGKRYADHYSFKTNNPTTGYWLDGLPHSVDPRAYQTFIIPGDFSNPNFNSYPSWANNAKVVVRPLNDADGKAVVQIDATNTWNSTTAGDWGAKGSKNTVRFYEGTMPRLSHKYRASGSSRIFFAPWETYFLLAEAAVRGWNVGISGKEAYEEGIRKSFEYFGTSQHVASYLASNEYNRAGTSVSWNHTVEPTPMEMNYIDGYTKAEGKVTYNYPVNNLYKNGSVRNDLLTKIITQKFIAQTPWLPLETWSDHRRLGLPFFENPAIENPLPNLSNLTEANYQTSQVKFFPQRLPYPSGLKNSNAAGYTQAVGHLGGADAVITPLWWAKKN